MNRFDNIDCLVGMAEYEDNHFDLAIVDPPYGIGIVEAINKSTVVGTSSMFYQTKGGNGSNFDTATPEKEYFDELFRVSKNQIIWGGNYFIEHLHNTKCFLIWDKMNGTNPMADAELAWSSFDSRVRIFRMHHFSQGYGDKIHPTQKPTKLYKWILDLFAKEGDLILDTHVGSASSLIACEDMGFNYVGFEIDKDYYDAAQKRLKQFRSQLKIDFKEVCKECRE